MMPVCRLKSVLILVIVCMSCMTPSDCPADAIAIDSIESLQRIGNDPAYPLDGHYFLTTDIDASDTANWEQSDGWRGFKPIGWGRTPAFSGVFNGRGHTVRGLYVKSRVSASGWALFARVESSGIICNLRVEDSLVEGALHTGGIVGMLRGIMINCEADVVVHGYFVGGLVGIAVDNSIILNSKATGFVGNYGNVVNAGGGLAGHATYVVNSMAACVVDGAGMASHPSGGLVGGIYESVIVSSYYDRDVAGIPHNDKGTPMSTSQMRTRATFEYWDFYMAWQFDEDKRYPRPRILDFFTGDLP